MNKTAILYLIVIAFGMVGCNTMVEYGDVRVDGRLEYDTYLGYGNVYHYTEPADIDGYTQLCLMKSNETLEDNFFATWSYLGKNRYKVIFTKGFSMNQWSESQNLGNGFSIGVNQKLKISPDCVTIIKDNAVIFRAPIFDNTNIYNGVIAKDICRRIEVDYTLEAGSYSLQESMRGMIGDDSFFWSY
ncbi:hypothetical protein K4L44_07220 [Halosquirtibacter laminarini]|uniref:Uncharacterized protein n=1 Tax=Halosquirtibacter laminarini TaxID=3374600 RepID=A0AC61NMG0_9BACT|nr:hypothetical protein K4L44_07220 [Prolixibacteraceae bacterium]